MTKFKNAIASLKALDKARRDFSSTVTLMDLYKVLTSLIEEYGEEAVMKAMNSDEEWEVEEFTTCEERNDRVKTLEDLGYTLGEDFIICD